MKLWLIRQLLGALVQVLVQVQVGFFLVVFKGGKPQWRRLQEGRWRPGSVGGEGWDRRSGCNRNSKKKNKKKQNKTKNKTKFFHYLSFPPCFSKGEGGNMEEGTEGEEAERKWKRRRRRRRSKSILHQYFPIFSGVFPRGKGTMKKTAQRVEV